MTNLLSRIMSCAAFLWLASMPSVVWADSDQELWDSWRSGDSVVLMRHALAPGNGDPANFSISDCDTQRNLSREGVMQASRVGELIRGFGMKDVDVYSSQWCRCVDTGVALAFSTPVALPMLNSFYQDRSTETQQTAELEQWVKTRLEKSENVSTLPAVLVTHQVNITALTSVFPASGEIVFITYKENTIGVLGSIETR